MVRMNLYGLVCTVNLDIFVTYVHKKKLHCIVSKKLTFFRKLYMYIQIYSSKVYVVFCLVCRVLKMGLGFHLYRLSWAYLY